MKFHRHEFHNTHPNVVPLIDVIMCLIIFFMLVARIGVSSGEDPSIRLPYAALGREIKSMDNALLINVREDPTTHLPEVSSQIDSAKGGGREPLILEGGGTGRKLVDVLKNLRSGKGRTDKSDFKLIIRGDSDMTFGVLQQVLLAASQAKITSLNFQTTQRPEGKS